jgi:hypothetical protein
VVPEKILCLPLSPYPVQSYTSPADDSSAATPGTETRLGVIAWLERDHQQGGIVNQSVLILTYKYATEGSHFKELGRAAEEITWGEGAHAHVWG